MIDLSNAYIVVNKTSDISNAVNKNKNDTIYLSQK